MRSIIITGSLPHIACEAPKFSDFRVSGEFRAPFDAPITLVGEGCPSNGVGERRSSEKWSRSDETCADNVEGLATQGDAERNQQQQSHGQPDGHSHRSRRLFSQITTIQTDLQNLKNALPATDPTLQAKIAADEAAIVKDGGPSMPANSQGMLVTPGMF